MGAKRWYSYILGQRVARNAESWAKDYITKSNFLQYQVTGKSMKRGEEFMC